MAKGRPKAAAPRRQLAPWLASTLLALVLVVPPFLVFPTLRDPFRLPKLLASEWLGLLSLLPLAWSAGRGEISGPFRPRVLVAVGPLVVLALSSLLTTLHPEASRRALPSLLIGAACLVGWSLAASTATLVRALRWSLIPAGLLAALGALQFHGLYRPFGWGRGTDGRLAITSLAGNAGDLGTYLVLPCLLAQWLAFRSRGRTRWLFGGAALLCAYGLLVSQTLAAGGALLVGSAVLWSLLLPPRRALAALGLVAGLTLVAVLTFTPLRQRLASKALPLLRGDWNEVLTYRLDGWAAARWMLAARPLSGVGFGGFRSEYTPAKEALLDRGRAFNAFARENTFANAHNDFLEVGAELGWPGLVALAWGVGMLLVAARRAAPDGRALVIAALGAMALAALAGFPFETALVAYPWLVFLAWIFRQEGGAEGPSSAAAAGRSGL